MLRNLSTLALAATLAATSCTQKGAENESTKTLVLFYSQTGATKAVAEELKNVLNADIDSIVAVNPYTGTFEETIERCQKEMGEDALPELKPLNADVAGYDTIYIGYPVWFGTYARPMLSYLKQTKLDGKVLIPFCTFGSGGLNTTTEALKSDQPNATVLEGYGVRNARIGSIKKELDRFLKENKYIAGDITPLAPYSEQKPVTEDEKKIFDEACGDYQFPLGTPSTVGSRTTADGIDYMYTVTSKNPDGKEATSIIYVTVAEGAKPEFTQVVR